MSARVERIAEILFLSFVFLLVNIRSFVYWTLFPDATFPGGEARRKVGLWLFCLRHWRRLVLGNSLHCRALFKYYSEFA